MVVGRAELPARRLRKGHRRGRRRRQRSRRRERADPLPVAPPLSILTRVRTDARPLALSVDEQWTWPRVWGSACTTSASQGR